VVLKVLTLEINVSVVHHCLTYIFMSSRLDMRAKLPVLLWMTLEKPGSKAGQRASAHKSNILPPTKEAVAGLRGSHRFLFNFKHRSCHT